MSLLSQRVNASLIWTDVAKLPFAGGLPICGPSSLVSETACVPELTKEVGLQTFRFLPSDKLKKSVWFQFVYLSL